MGTYRATLNLSEQVKMWFLVNEPVISVHLPPVFRLLFPAEALLWIPSSLVRLLIDRASLSPPALFWLPLKMVAHHNCHRWLFHQGLFYAENVNKPLTPGRNSSETVRMSTSRLSYKQTFQ